MTLIKVCGIKSAADALETARLGADIIGLVFAESRRRVSLQQAAEISLAVRKLPRRTAIAGVFVNESPTYINDIALRLGLDMVQLSGDESAEYCLDILFPVIKVVHVTDSMSADSISEAVSHLKRVNPGRGIIPLLDSGKGKKYGGTGETFDHSLAKLACSAGSAMIAGGLNPGNVVGLVRDVKPLGVDVSSGVETNGRKDMAKIRTFIEAVRSADTGTPTPGFIEKYLQKGEQNVAR